MTMYRNPPLSLNKGKQDSRAVFRSDPTPHRGSIEAHARATIAQMKPEKRWQFLNQMLAEEIVARHDAYKERS